MFKRYVLGYLVDSKFKVLSKNKHYIPLIDTAMLLNEKISGYRFVVFDRREKIYIYN